MSKSNSPEENSSEFRPNEHSISESTQERFEEYAPAELVFPETNDDIANWFGEEVDGNPIQQWFKSEIESAPINAPAESPVFQQAWINVRIKGFRSGIFELHN